MAVLGILLDVGTGFRPGARFGANDIREASRQLRPCHQALDAYPFKVRPVADAGDRGATRSTLSAVASIQKLASEFSEQGPLLVTLGGDHTIALPLLRVMPRCMRPSG